MEMSSEASRALASVEARLATAMELITSAFRDIALLRTGQVPQQLERAIRPAEVSEESEPTLRSPQHAQLLNMIRARKSGHLLGEIHTWSEQNLGWDETATNDALQDLVESEHLEEPVIREQGIIYVAIRKVERHINTIDPKLLVAIMEVLVSAVPLERVRDMLSTFSEGWTTSQVRTALQALRTDGYVQMIGARRNARWEKIAELPEIYAKHVRNEEPFENEHYQPAERPDRRSESNIEDDFAIGEVVPRAIIPTVEEGEEDELLLEASPAKATTRTKKPVTDHDWESLMLDALEDNGGTMDFEQLVTHCKQYSSRYGFDTSVMSRDVVFNGIASAHTKLKSEGKITQDGQTVILVEVVMGDADDEDESEGRSLTLIQQAAMEQHQVLPKPPKKDGRHKPTTLTDWVWLVYDMIIWAHEEHRRSLSIAGIAINLAKEPAEVQWTIAGMDYKEVLRAIRVAIPFVLNNCPDVEVMQDGDRKKYRIIMD